MSAPVPSRRRTCMAMIVVAAFVAGCVDPGDPSGDGPSTIDAGWTLQCPAIEAPSADWPQDCVHRASTSTRTKAELWVAINPIDPTNVVLGAKDMNPTLSRDCTWNRIAVTHDSGHTWTELSIGGTLAERGPESEYYPWACNTDPMFVFTSEGVLYSVLELYALGPGPNALGKGSPTNFANAGVAFYLVESHDGGRSWSDPRDLLTLPGLAAAPDHPWMVYNPRSGTLHIALLDYLVGHRCYVLNVRADQQDAELVVLPTPDRRGCTQAAVTNDGTLVVGGHEPATASIDTVRGGVRTVWFAQSTDDGRTFSEPSDAFDYLPLNGRFAESDHEANSIMRLVSDPTDARRVFAVYDGLVGDDGEVWIRSSDDAGVTWTEAVPMSTDDTMHHQFLPGLAVSQDGVLHAFFMDKRYDPGNALIDITYAQSQDNGASWTNRRVTTESWDGSLSRHQYGHAWIGDYLGVAAVGADVWAAFPDASLGDAPSMAAAHVAWVAAAPSDEGGGFP
jgi:hypothetical protein